jgi:2',3'-cyclic-nucleotide 2'-phosphodiesterase (5'-nucleotidase family)
MQNYGTIFVTFLLAGLMALFSCTREQQVSILITGNGQGQIDCIDQQQFCLATLARSLAEAKSGCEFIHFDIGNNSFGSEYSYFTDGLLPAGAVNQLGIDCGILSTEDIYYAGESYRSLVDSLNYPVVGVNSGNIESETLTSYSIHRVGDIRLGIAGYIDPELASRSGFAGNEAEQYRSDLKASITRTIYMMLGSVDIILLAGPVSDRAGNELADLELPVILLQYPLESLTDATTDSGIILDRSRISFLSWARLSFNCDIGAMKRIRYVDRPARWKEWVTGLSVEYRDTEGRQDESIKSWIENQDKRYDSFLYSFAAVVKSEIDNNTESRAGSTTIGNFVTDAIRKQTKSRIVIMPRSSINGIIAEGNITERDIYRVLPYRDRLVYCMVNGLQLRDLINFCYKNNIYLEISGLRLYHDTETGNIEVLLDGKKPRPAGLYSIAMPGILHYRVESFCTESRTGSLDPALALLAEMKQRRVIEESDIDRKNRIKL